jgi:hypothetical protein
MNIGKPLREIVVEPLESPVPSVAPDPEPAEPEPAVPAREPHPDPVQQPA